LIFAVLIISTGDVLIFQNASPSKLMIGKTNLRDRVEMNKTLNVNTERKIIV
jgi:hypothetical protein